MLSVSVIIPARDAAATLPRTLRALAEQQLDGDHEVIVVDNGSHDDTGAVAAAYGARVVRRARGQGPGAARSAGAAHARAERLAFVDSDCVPAPGWLAAGLAALEHAELVQGRVLPEPEVEMRPFDRSVRVTELTWLFESANMFVTRACLEAVGGFGAGLEPAGEAPFGEDALFGWAAVAHGARVAFCEQALVHHAVEHRDLPAFLRERRRLALFPALVARLPGLRERALYRRWFLTRRSAAFDAALAAAALAALSGRRAPLLAAAPYAGLVLAQAVAWGPRLGPRAALGAVAGDALGGAALLAGSVGARAPVL